MHDKEKIWKLGGRWDSSCNRWLAPGTVDWRKFIQWIPEWEAKLPWTESKRRKRLKMMMDGLENLDDMEVAAVKKARLEESINNTIVNSKIDLQPEDRVCTCRQPFGISRMGLFQCYICRIYYHLECENFIDTRIAQKDRDVFYQKVRDWPA